VAYVPNAVPSGDGTANLQPLSAAQNSAQLSLAGSDGKAVTQVTLFNQGPIQMLQAAVTGLEPKAPYILALANDAKGETGVQPLAPFMTNPAGAAIVNAVGPIRQVVTDAEPDRKRYLVILAGTPDKPGTVLQSQAP
jgi:hypothetical protein